LQVNNEEWQFFLSGGAVLDRSQQPPNPAPTWCSETMWDCITVRYPVYKSFLL
jgi:dynein heavy chain